MSGLREHIDELERRNGIPSDSILLRKIYIKLGKDPNKARKSDAGNFSKMINGDRKLSIEYAVALESIFNVNLDYLLNGSNQYKSFANRGLEYTAYQDSLELYRKLYNETDSDGNRIFGNYDEYQQTIVNYIIKYHSLNGIIFMFQNGLVKFQAWQNRFNFSEGLWFDGGSEQQFELIKMIFEIDDAEMFANTFDFEAAFNVYDTSNYVLFSDAFIKLCLDSKNIFNYLIKWHKVDLKLMNPHLGNHDYSTNEMYTCHAFLNYMIKYAIANAYEYHDKLIEMLKNANNNNYHVVNHIKNEIGLHSLNQLKVMENGYVVDGMCRLAIIATYDLPIDPDLDEDIKRRIKDLMTYANQITFNDSYNWDGTLKVQWLRQGDMILRKSSNNPVEYEMLDKMRKSGFDGVPKLVSSENLVDKFEYIDGCNAKSIINLPNGWLSMIATYLKEFHSICKNELHGKVYCHNSLSTKNIIFDSENSEIKAIVDWKDCSIGEETDDLICVIVNWIGLDDKNYLSPREKKLELIEYFINEYGADDSIKNNFGNKIIDFLNSTIAKLDKTERLYVDKFYKYKESLIFVELYLDDLNNL